MSTMSDEEFERRSAEIRARRRETDEYMLRRIEELQNQEQAREEERRRAERRQRLIRFVPFLH